jgi:hypothetical protein
MELIEWLLKGITPDKVNATREVLAVTVEDFPTWAPDNREKVNTAYQVLDAQGLCETLADNLSVAEVIDGEMDRLAVLARRAGIGPLVGTYTPATPDPLLDEIEKKMSSVANREKKS